MLGMMNSPNDGVDFYSEPENGMPVFDRKVDKPQVSYMKGEILNVLSAKKGLLITFSYVETWIDSNLKIINIRRNVSAE